MLPILQEETRRDGMESEMKKNRLCWTRDKLKAQAFVLFSILFCLFQLQFQFNHSSWHAEQATRFVQAARETPPGQPIHVSDFRFSSFSTVSNFLLFSFLVLFSFVALSPFRCVNRRLYSFVCTNIKQISVRLCRFAYFSCNAPRREIAFYAKLRKKTKTKKQRELQKKKIVEKEQKI